MRRLFLIFLYLFTGTIFADTLTIVNMDLSTGRLSSSEVRNIYLMRYRRWPDGQRVIVFQMPESSYVFKSFVREVLGMSVADYVKEWRKSLNAGNSSDVRRVKNVEQMLHGIQTTPNSIGYIDSDNIVVNSGTGDVKVLHIDF